LHGLSPLPLLLTLYDLGFSSAFCWKRRDMTTPATGMSVIASLEQQCLAFSGKNKNAGKGEIG
jgi:hypothetical protein